VCVCVCVLLLLLCPIHVRLGLLFISVPRPVVDALIDLEEAVSPNVLSPTHTHEKLAPLHVLSSFLSLPSQDSAFPYGSTFGPSEQQQQPYITRFGSIGPSQGTNKT